MIDRVEVLVLTHRLSRIRLYGTGSNLTRDSVVVRAVDRDGVVGWGETYLVPGVVAGARGLAEVVVGQEPDAAGVALARGTGVHRWALGAVSMAVDDLRARRRGVPVSALYGSRARERVRAYASSRGYVEGSSAEAAWREEADLVRAAGFRIMKLRVGRGALDEELAAIERTVAAAPDLTWMADGNGAFTYDEGLRLGRAAEALGFRWLEEPLPTTDHAGYAGLAAELTVPLAGGESLESASAAEAPLRLGAYDIIQPDVSIAGGIGGALEVAALAQRRGAVTVPHACNGAIALAATLQLLAVLPSADGAPPWAEPILEHDVGENPMRTDLLTDPIAVRDGWVEIPDRPGLGIDVDESVVRRLAAEA